MYSYILPFCLTVAYFSNTKHLSFSLNLLVSASVNYSQVGFLVFFLQNLNQWLAPPSILVKSNLIFFLDITSWSSKKFSTLDIHLIGSPLSNVGSSTLFNHPHWFSFLSCSYSSSVSSVFPNLFPYIDPSLPSDPLSMFFILHRTSSIIPRSLWKLAWYFSLIFSIAQLFSFTNLSTTLIRISMPHLSFESGVSDQFVRFLGDKEPIYLFQIKNPDTKITPARL